MISYIDIFQFVLIGVIVVFAAGNILALRTMNKFLDEFTDAMGTMQSLYQENRFDIVEIKEEINSMLKSEEHLETDVPRFKSLGLHGVINDD